MELFILLKSNKNLKALVAGLLIILITACDSGVDNDNIEEPKDYLEYGSVITDGLLAYYPFDGNAEDYSGNGLNGIENGVLATKGRFDQEDGALKFHGDNDFIEVPQFSEINNKNGTICFWARIPSGIHVENQAAVISRRDTIGEGYTLSLYGSTSYWFEFKDANNQRFGEYMWTNYGSNNKYLFVAVTFTNQKTSSKNMIKYYFQGYPTSETTITTDSQFSFNNNKQSLYIGKSLLTKYTYFNGEIDDLLIYDRALTDEEILKLYEWE